MRALNNFPSIAIFTLYYYNNLEEFHIMKPIFFLMGIVYILHMTIMSSDQLIMLIILNINVTIFFFFLPTKVGLSRRGSGRLSKSS